MERQKNRHTEEEILAYIDKLKKNPGGKARFLTDLGITGVGIAGAGFTAAAVGTTTSAVGWGITTLTGAVFVTAAPLALVASAAIAGGAAVYGATQVVRSQSRHQGIIEQMIRQLEEMRRDLEYVTRASTVTTEDKTNFTLLLEGPLRLNLIDAEDASDLIAMVENGQMPLIQAYKLVKDIIEEFQINEEDRKAS